MAEALAERVVKTTLALADAALRAAHVRTVLLAEPLQDLAAALDAIALEAELGDARAREVLVALVDAFADPATAHVVQQLREQAAGEQLLALDRLLRTPHAPARSGGSDRPARPPDYGFGRPLTLGERKSLARKPDRALLERLVSDPHPDVIERVLANPRLTEEDVMRIASKRPGRADVLSSIARSKWVHRPRVRLALLLNPMMPLDLAIPIAALLRRPELKLVAEYTYCSAALRSVCLEHYKRRVPLPGEDDEGPLQ
jgi:hypothetical protein